MTTIEVSALRVLVVDDSSLVRCISRCAREAGFEVEQAMNGLEAMEKALRRFDLLIVDVNMPKMDGSRFFELRRSGAPAGPGARHHDRAGEQDAGGRSPARIYLVKPVAESELQSYVAVLTGAPR